MNLGSNRSRSHQDVAVTVPQKLSWHLVKAVNRRTQEEKLLLVKKCRPDFARFARAKHIRAWRSEKLPHHWNN